jgi:hypothetical protein
LSLLAGAWHQLPQRPATVRRKCQDTLKNADEKLSTTLENHRLLISNFPRSPRTCADFHSWPRSTEIAIRTATATRITTNTSDTFPRQQPFSKRTNHPQPYPPNLRSGSTDRLLAHHAGDRDRNSRERELCAEQLRKASLRAFLQEWSASRASPTLTRLTAHAWLPLIK